jgi:hypothetical protein
LVAGAPNFGVHVGERWPGRCRASGTETITFARRLAAVDGDVRIIDAVNYQRRWRALATWRIGQGG